MRYLLALGTVFFREPKWKIRKFFEPAEDIAEVFNSLSGDGGKELRDFWN